MTKPRSATARWRCNLGAHHLGDPAARGWRARLARWLRRRADRLDGHFSLAVHVRTRPSLPRAVVDRAIKIGIGHAHDLLTGECRQAALDRTWLRVYPQYAGDGRAPAPARRADS